MSLKAFIIYVTKCGHTTRLPIDVQLGHPFSCLVCHKRTTITDIHTLEWHAKCNYRRCHFGAWTGLSQDLAEQAATRHLRNAGNHDGQSSIEAVLNGPTQSRVRGLECRGRVGDGDGLALAAWLESDVEAEVVQRVEEVRGLGLLLNRPGAQ